MRFSPRRLILGLIATGLVGMALLPSLAIEPAESKPAEVPAKPEAPAARKGYDPIRRVPPHFAKVGLSAEQREQIYKVRAQHYDRIGQLRRELREQQVKMLGECEEVLTDVQRKLLDEHRRGSATRKEKVAEVIPKPDVK